MITLRLNEENAGMTSGSKFYLILDSFHKCSLNDTIRYMTIIDEQYLVLDTKVKLSDEKIRQLADAMKAEICPLPEIKEGMTFESTIDPVQYCAYKPSDAKFAVSTLRERVIRIPNGRLYVNGAPFRGGFSNEDIQLGKWISSTYLEDWESMHNFQDKDRS